MSFPASVLPLIQNSYREAVRSRQTQIHSEDLLLAILASGGIVTKVAAEVGLTLAKARAARQRLLDVALDHYDVPIQQLPVQPYSQLTVTDAGEVELSAAAKQALKFEAAGRDPEIALLLQLLAIDDGCIRLVEQVGCDLVELRQTIEHEGKDDTVSIPRKPGESARMVYLPVPLKDAQPLFTDVEFIENSLSPDNNSAQAAGENQWQTPVDGKILLHRLSSEHDDDGQTARIIWYSGLELGPEQNDKRTSYLQANLSVNGATLTAVELRHGMVKPGLLRRLFVHSPAGNWFLNNVAYYLADTCANQIADRP